MTHKTENNNKKNESPTGENSNTRFFHLLTDETFHESHGEILADGVPLKPSEVAQRLKSLQTALRVMQQDKRFLRNDYMTRLSQKDQELGLVKASVPEAGFYMPSYEEFSNSAKHTMIGEFYETIEVTCPECGGESEEGDDSDDIQCLECCDQPLSQKVYVSWDTMKAIYKKMVGSFGVDPRGGQS